MKERVVKGLFDVEIGCFWRVCRLHVWGNKDLKENFLTQSE